jgi:integrase
MRPLKLGLLSSAHHVFVRNCIYYYRTDIPTDLKHYFPTSEIKQSLKTKDSKIAKVLAIRMEYKIQQAFCLIRSGMLPEDIIMQVVDSIKPTKQSTAEVRGKLLSEVIELYEVEKESEWTYKTKLEVMGCHKLIVDVLGNIEVKVINKQTLLDFRSKLMKLPSNIYKKYSGKTIQQILELSDIQPMSTTSINKHIMRLNALLGYAVKEGIVTTNYCHGMMLSDKRRADELRKVYDIADLKLIVSRLTYDPDKPERYWIPVIAMYSGMRLDEICQLYVEDVQQIDGVWCLNINDEKDKKLKNISSKRVVPVHPFLISNRFIQYVESMMKYGVPRLWMNLTWREADGYSNSIGNWYRRFNREHISEDKSKVFHSFRHTFTDTLKQAGVLETVIAELVGHSSNGSMTMGRYGKRYQPKILLEALMQLDYGVNIQTINF